MASPEKKDNRAKSDDELIRLAQQGDQAAVNTLLERYTATVRSVASCSFGASLEPDDLAQEGMLGLLAAVYSYAPEKAASFHTYASVCISNRIRSAVRADTRLKHSPLNSSVPLNDANISPGGNPEDLFVASEQAEQILAVLAKELTPLESQVLRAFLVDKSYRVVAGKLSLTEKAVDNALQRIRKKLRNSMQEGS
ncbi:MAG: sigma-70 family RNA polymerase sigma factor [Ruminococcaceae bacterium]|nr:sigma-70 family RNA polymerase sigma factor [Oscillospiraceae bacterium]